MDNYTLKLYSNNRMDLTTTSNDASIILTGANSKKDNIKLLGDLLKQLTLHTLRHTPQNHKNDPNTGIFASSGPFGCRGRGGEKCGRSDEDHGNKNNNNT